MEIKTQVEYGDVAREFLSHQPLIYEKYAKKNKGDFEPLKDIIDNNTLYGYNLDDIRAFYYQNGTKKAFRTKFKKIPDEVADILIAEMQREIISICTQFQWENSTPFLKEMNSFQNILIDIPKNKEKLIKLLNFKNFDTVLGHYHNRDKQWLDVLKTELDTLKENDPKFYYTALIHKNCRYLFYLLDRTYELALDKIDENLKDIESNLHATVIKKILIDYAKDKNSDITQLLTLSEFGEYFYFKEDRKKIANILLDRENINAFDIFFNKDYFEKYATKSKLKNKIVELFYKKDKILPYCIEYKNYIDDKKDFKNTIIEGFQEVSYLSEFSSSFQDLRSFLTKKEIEEAIILFLKNNTTDLKGYLFLYDFIKIYELSLVQDFIEKEIEYFIKTPKNIIYRQLLYYIVVFNKLDILKSLDFEKSKQIVKLAYKLLHRTTYISKILKNINTDFYKTMLEEEPSDFKKWFLDEYENLIFNGFIDFDLLQGKNDIDNFSDFFSFKDTESSKQLYYFRCFLNQNKLKNLLDYAISRSRNVLVDYSRVIEYAIIEKVDIDNFKDYKDLAVLKIETANKKFFGRPLSNLELYLTSEEKINDCINIINKIEEQPIVDDFIEIYKIFNNINESFYSINNYVFSLLLNKSSKLQEALEPFSKNAQANLKFVKLIIQKELVKINYSSKERFEFDCNNLFSAFVNKNALLIDRTILTTF
ncbi:hypothetical protein [Campylobacter sp. RM12651]|uniref:hypothetical protein n=1 Tax=Campylobacter sp. RM12651 TaxID=1660079 RepID=UPI001EFBD381|nr:hypothetical protein [Campylobacter sp. RM12651]ULO04568.1 hypothetical protein AVBRAN_a0086 [Campylobacter sp. RM12651]